MSLDTSQVGSPNDTNPVEEMVKKYAGPAAASAVGPLVTQAEGRIMQNVSSTLTQTGLDQAGLVKRIDSLEANLTAAGTQLEGDVLTRVHANPKYEIALGFLAFAMVGAGGLIVLVYYLNGNHYAANIKDAAAAVFLPLLWHLYQQWSAPKVPVPVTPLVGPATVTATATTA